MFKITLSEIDHRTQSLTRSRIRLWNFSSREKWCTKVIKRLPDCRISKKQCNGVRCIKTERSVRNKFSPVFHEKSCSSNSKLIQTLVVVFTWSSLLVAGLMAADCAFLFGFLLSFAFCSILFFVQFYFHFNSEKAARLYWEFFSQVYSRYFSASRFQRSPSGSDEFVRKMENHGSMLVQYWASVVHAGPVLCQY